jgi:hypothetical protein
MALPFPSESLQPEGILEFKYVSKHLIYVYFTPPVAALPTNDQDPENYRRRIIEIEKLTEQITIIPFRVWTDRPMSLRYSKLKKITIDLPWHIVQNLEDDLDVDYILYSGIPETFTQDINYGFGFKKHYGQIVSLLEKIDIEHLIVSEKEKTIIDTTNRKAIINKRDLDQFRRTADNIIRRSQKLTTELKRNAISEEFFKAIGSVSAAETNSGKLSKEDFVKLIGKTNRFAEGGASETEQKDALTVIRNNAKRMTEQKPQELIKLKNDLELVNLEQLIERFQKMMTNKVSEAQWQRLFQDNPFIISMVFGIPAVNVQGQASVGGRRLSGGGEKIADFLVKNSLSNNTAIVEIKTPATELVSLKAYRRNVHGPAQELSAAVSQVLDQVYQLQKEINGIKANSRLYDIESYFVQGILIAGLTPLRADEQKSFEYFRGNSKNVQILTFDELLEKMRSLYQFLLPDKPKGKESVDIDEDDLPF